MLSYFRKEIKARPDEKISYIIASHAGSYSTSKSMKRNGIIIAAAFLLSGLIFLKPHIFYESAEDGYHVRFYTIGLIDNVSTLEIPYTYNGKSVVSIRGDVFANIRTLQRVILPDSIIEIRGGAFKNCTNLEFIDLPNYITEIKGNTFEGCSSLEEIDIPDGVTRIGGHAFYGCSSLSDVYVPESVREIGSSAFRNCDSLHSVMIPKNASVNERAFKDSPTIINRY